MSFVFCPSGVPFVKPFDQKSVNLVEDDTLTLKCNAWGYPIPTLSWVRTTLDTHIDTSISTDGDNRSNVAFVDLSSSVLTYTRMTIADYQLYICVANNELGSSNTSTLVRVKGIRPSQCIFIYMICRHFLNLRVICWSFFLRQQNNLHNELHVAFVVYIGRLTGRLNYEYFETPIVFRHYRFHMSLYLSDLIAR